MSVESTQCFLDKQRLLRGPWQAFERDVARLFLANGFSDVRLVGGSGDQGADILAVKKSLLWVIQCKHTATSPPTHVALDEVLNAGRAYSADKLIIATSRPASESLRSKVAKQRELGVDVALAEPSQLLEWAKNSPEYPADTRTLHPYQQDAAQRLVQALKDVGKGQLVLATGLGKTVIIAESTACLLRDKAIPHNRVLVLAHTRELVDQLLRSFWLQLPKWVHTHRLADGETPTFWEGITFATVQSATNQRDELPPFGMVLIDEAHHAGALTYRETLDAIKPEMIAGVTATPWRGDGYDIDVLLGEPLVKIGIAEGLEKGFLSEVDYRLLADNLDWEFVQAASAHNYSLTQLNRRLILPTRDDEAARVTVEIFQKEKRRGGIVYCPTGVHAKEFAGTLRQFGLKAEAILHDSEPRSRELMLSQFRAGLVDFICTVDLFNEGIDVPDVDMIVFMRATHSRRIFVQQLGRGLRTSKGKDKVIVLDFVTDLRRIAEVIDLDAAAKGGNVERLGLGSRLVSFTNQSAGSFLREWMIDQASLFLREGDPNLELPRFNFPQNTTGGVQ